MPPATYDLDGWPAPALENGDKIHGVLLFKDDGESGVSFVIHPEDDGSMTVTMGFDDQDAVYYELGDDVSHGTPDSP